MVRNDLILLGILASGLAFAPDAPAFSQTQPAYTIVPRLEAPPRLAYCADPGHPHPEAVSAHAPGRVAIGDGLSVDYGESLAAPPPGAFHITYRTWLARFDLYGDGTVDADIGDESARTGRVRYHIAASEVTGLARQLRALQVWTANRPQRVPEDGYWANFDIVMDGRRATGINGEPKAMALIVKTVRADVLRRNLEYRMALLDARGFRFDSAAGADFALAVASNPAYGDAGIERLLERRVPCVGGRYVREVLPPIGAPQPLSLQQALINGGYARQARRLAPPPAITQGPVKTEVVWQAFPGADLVRANYPARAMTSEIEGSATLDCLVTETGRLTPCQIVGEAPLGYGFGLAAAKLLEDKARATIGSFQPGAYVEVKLRWTLN